MWLIFAGLALTSVVLLAAYDRWMKAIARRAGQAAGQGKGGQEAESV
jgi:hypothetical protein